jgi:hypothetical protein
MKKQSVDIPPGIKLVEARNVGEGLAVAVPNE